MKAWKHDGESGAVWNWVAMVMVRVLLLGILFVSNHRVNSLFCPAHGCTNSRFIIAELQIPRTREHVFLGSVWWPRTETVQVKSVLGVSSPFEVSSCSMQIRAGSLLCIGLFWSWTAPPRHTLVGIRNFREIWAQAAFFWLKGSSFQIYSSVLKALLSV